MYGIPAELVADLVDEPVLQHVTALVADPRSFTRRVQYLYDHREETSQDELLLKDGRVIDRYSAPMFSTDGRCYGRVWYFRDITERKHLEEERLRYTKLESLGHLAGGIAHDFHNILTAILGDISLAILEDSPGNGRQERLLRAENACQQARALAQQLLTYAKGGAPRSGHNCRDLNWCKESPVVQLKPPSLVLRMQMPSASPARRKTSLLNKT